MKATQDRDRGPATALALAYFAALGPDEPRMRSRAFSPAGHLWQRGLVGGLAAAGLEASPVVGFPPFPAFPEGPLVVRSRAESRSIPGLPPARLVGYPNLPLIKILAIGVRAALALRRWARATPGKTRVALLYNVSVPPAWLLAAVARKYGVHLVASLNDIWIPGALVPATAGRRLDYVLQRWAIRRLSAALVVSEAIAADFLGSVPYLRVEGGVFPEQVRAGIRWRRDSPGFTVGFAGSLEPYNGVREVLAAAEALAGEGVCFRIAGAGSLAPEVARRAAACPAVEYVGALDLERVPEFYGGCDLLLNWRTTRAIDLRYFFPSKLLELLASGVPVLSTRMSGVLDGFGDHLLVSDDESATALAAAVRRAARTESAELRALGERAARFTAENFDWTMQGRRIRDFFERTLRNGSEAKPDRDGLGAETA